MNPAAIYGLTAAADIAGQVGSGIFGAIHAKKTWKRNQRAWRRMNKYNHPSAQMERLKEAGLNPLMIYGSSPGSATGNTSNYPEYKAPENIDFNPKGLQKIATYANINQVKAQTLTEENRAWLIGEQAKEKAIENNTKTNWAFSNKKGKVVRWEDMLDEYVEFVRAERELKILERDIKSGTKEDIINSASQALRKATADATISEKEAIIRNFEAMLIQNFGLNKAFALAIISGVLSRFKPR